MKINSVSKKIFIYISAALTLVLVAFFSYSLITGKISFGAPEDGWDGVSVAASFKAGNGTQDNPYVISTPEEFAYFKNVIEGDNYTSFSDKYYILDNDIDLNNKEISSIGNVNLEEERVFRGHFDGAGYKISNILLLNNGLFTKTEDASIDNLILDNIEIRVEDNNDIGFLIGDVSLSEDNTSSFNNIVINNFKIDISNIDRVMNINILTSKVVEKVSFKNIFLKGKIINNELDNTIGLINGEILGDVSNIITDISLDGFDFKREEINKQYFVLDDGIYLDNKIVDTKEFLDVFNDGLVDYYWDYTDAGIIFKKKEEVMNKVNETPKFSFSIRRAPSISLHASGIENNIVYINDLDSDYNHYMGLNYTTSSSETLPTGVNQGIYSNDNLVKVYIHYSSVDINDDSIFGTVSNTEAYKDIYYYKYYPVVDGYVSFDLIDNPWANRPNGKAFNGWVAIDEAAKVSLDMDTYTRKVKVPATGGETINLEFLTSWTEATTVTSNSFTNLKSRGMVHYAPTTETIYEDMSVYYVEKEIGWRTNYPTGQNIYTTGGTLITDTRCGSFFGCSYLIKNDTSEYDAGTTYYELTFLANGNANVSRHTATYTVVVTPYFNNGENMGGNFEKVTVGNGGSLEGLYNNTGNILSGSCTTNSCVAYKLVQYYDENGNLSIVDSNKDYYYLVTRDTNIMALSSTVSDVNGSKPVTITGLNNGVLRNATIRIDSSNYSLSLNADTRIEYINIQSTANNSSSLTSNFSSSIGSNVIVANYNNLKIGRGINVTNNKRISGVWGGTALRTSYTQGSSNSLTRYSLIVESGDYNNIYFSESSQAEGTLFVDAYCILGNDIDRIKNNNSSLDVNYSFQGNAGKDFAMRGVNDLSRLYNITVKSGSYGTGKSGIYSGIYVGGRGGLVRGNRSIIVEGGYIYSLIGGLGPLEEVKNLNAIYINLKGGSTDMVFAASGSGDTYGNRIVNATGGIVNYAIFGGSNGSTITATSSDNGILHGDTFVYVGGNCVVGDTSITEPLFGVDPGSVFGAGNGNTNKDTLGSTDNASIVIDGNATINGNVYGGGNFGSVGALSDSNTCQTNIIINGGNISGSVYGGGNNRGSGSDDVSSTVNIAVNNGHISSSVYGGSRTKGIIYGDTNVTINGGDIDADVYGGGEGGYTDTNNYGTYVADNVSVVVNNGNIDGNVYGGSAYGSVNTLVQNATASTSTTEVTINGGVIHENVFGGAKGSSDYTPQVAGDIEVNVNGGNVGAVYGGFDASGSPTAGDVVYLTDGIIGNAYGGGRNASQATTDIRLQGADVTGDLFGGSNLNGTINTSNVTVTSGTVSNIYGGNNIDGTTVTSNVNVTGGDISGDIYGGGNKASTTTSNVVITGTTVNDIYGGGKEAGVDTTNVEINNTTSGTVYGGSNISGNVNSSDVSVNNSTLTALYGGNNQGGRVEDATLEVNNSNIGNVFGGGNNAQTGDSHVTVNSGNITNLFGGGNNSGGYTASTSVNVTGGVIGTIYGGGNEAQTGSATTTLGSCQATDVYGGGNAAGVNLNTELTINSTTVNNNIYGGGNEGVVNGNTKVYVHNGIIKGNAFAGGNGSSAIVYKNSEITIDGASVIGTESSVAPNGGCVFGSGNAASTGSSSTNNSKATVNLVGGKVYGNVYGGPKMAVVYGTTDTNIGYAAVNDNTLTKDDIIISGTVFGGGESNASGSETYDWNFISVTQGIDVNINGTGYNDNNLDFIINGSIFGSGNASSSSGESNIYIKNLGTLEKPNKSISIQRANYLEIDSSVIELSGTTDRTNEYSDILYSFNMIDKMVIKNGTTLLLMHNANMLKELYSGVDSGGTLVPAVVDIDDENKTITKNVDNRIYMKPGQNLNVTINQAATAYGKVTGMTFFGMYSQYENGHYNFGLYDKNVNYGDAGSASMMVVGGSYVIGLHSVNHDITKDGFYSNYLDEEFTEVSTAYIDPSEIGETGYRWIIGFEAINYSFTLNASKYSSLGTNELQLIDFADGSTTFSVLDFDASGLNQGVSLVDPNNVPRIGATQAEANSVFGLAMKAETQEWTGHGTTKYYSSSPRYDGTLNYKTDTRKLPPSLMFYLYHTKNIDAQGPLGTVVVTLRAEIPKNAIEYDIKYITITIDLVAKKYNDADSYDASITYDKKYEMPSSTSVNITNQSQFTAYFSMIANTNDFEEFYGHNNSNYRVLTSNNPLPVGTLITMIDNAQNSSRPEYYYFEVTDSVYNNSLTQLQNDHEVSYRLSDFIKMDSTSTNNTYSDQDANLAYYDSDIGIVDEEFLFIFDFKETTVTGNHPGNTILFEMRNNEDRTVYNVLGIRQSLMVYNTFESSNVVLQQNIDFGEPYIYYGIDHEYGYSTLVQYNETENRQPVIDTNYESSNMGINISLLDRNGDAVSSSLLIGTSININNQEYFADGDGIFRIKLADKVTNLSIRPKITATKDLPVGEYTLRCTLFASSDGLHNSVYENSVTQEFTVHVVGSDNAIVVDSNDLEKVVIGENGLNLNDSKTNTYTVTYESELNNPNLRVEIYKRKVNDVNSTEYESIPFNNLFKERLTATTGNEKYINIGNSNTGNVSFTLNDTLISGTYKIVFKLYDNNQIIDDDVKYVIVKKSVE